MPLTFFSVYRLCIALRTLLDLVSIESPRHHLISSDSGVEDSVECFSLPSTFTVPLISGGMSYIYLSFADLRVDFQILSAPHMPPSSPNLALGLVPIAQLSHSSPPHQLIHPALCLSPLLSRPLTSAYHGYRPYALQTSNMPN